MGFVRTLYDMLTSGICPCSCGRIMFIPHDRNTMEFGCVTTRKICMTLMGVMVFNRENVINML